MEKKLQILQRRIERERAARKAAEAILEKKSRELYYANEKLAGVNQELEERIVERTKELEEKVKSLKVANEELNEITQVVSHDLKSPLRAIGSLISFLEEDIKGTPVNQDVYDYVNLIRRRVKRMQNLLNGILEYINIGKTLTRIDKVELKGLLDAIIWNDLQKPTDFQIEIKGDFPIIYANGLRLKQAIKHLVENAIKYHHNLEEGKVTIEGILTMQGYDLCISDNGPGIPERYHEKVFKIFQLLESRDTTESTGIGLPIVKKIVEFHGGEIILESDFGIGAKFIMRFPKDKIQITN